MLKLAETKDITGGSWLKYNSKFGQNRLVGACFDSRKYDQQSIFVALQGETNDGHDYLSDLDDKPLDLIIVSRRVNFSHKTASYLQVNDTAIALQHLASHVINKYKGLIITVTGSNGKTTFKTWLSVVLNEKYKVYHSPQSFNNQIGLPVTILGLEESSQIMILEVGTNNFGEIDSLAKIAKAHCAVLLNVGMAHIGNFGSMEAIYEEKQAIFNYLRAPKIALVPKQDKSINVPDGCRKLCFESECELDSISAQVSSYKLSVQGKTEIVETKLIGDHVAYNLSAISLLASELGVSFEAIVNGISKLENISGRLQVCSGINGSLLIDDCYNANPNSLVNLFNSMKFFKDYRRILVLGDFAEIEGFEQEIAEYMLEHISDQFDQILSIGKLGFRLKDLKSDLRLIPFSDKRQLINHLRAELTSGVIVAFKASRAAKLEELMQQFIDK